MMDNNKFMLKTKFVLWCAILIILAFAAMEAFCERSKLDQENILFTIVDPQQQIIQLYWKDENGAPFKSIERLITKIENNHKKLLLVMNGGMFNQDFAPQGLYIENHTALAPIDTGSGDGNFYMKPNGVFYITDKNKAFVCSNNEFKLNKTIKYATQSGPMLLVDGLIHPAFKSGSKNLNIRNGVGILPNNQVVFAMSKQEITFYDFAEFFKNLGCKNALYLDGFVSRTYLPAKQWVQTDGNFGVMIAVIKK